MNVDGVEGESDHLLCVDVLLPVYNGVRFIEKQINSILNQNHVSVSIYIVDDGSDDGSWDKITYLCEQNRGKIHAVRRQKNKGLLYTINQLLDFGNSSYVALADQDDFWLPNKLSSSLDRLRVIETCEKNTLVPSLVFTDLKVCDSSLSSSLGSFWHLHHISRSDLKFRKLLCRNIATGCTFVFNRKLVETLKYIPEGAIIHDWWIVAVAKLVGKVEMLPFQSVEYRIHERNVVGVDDVRSVNVVVNIVRNKQYSRYKEDLLRGIRSSFIQAELLLQWCKYQKDISPEKKRVLKKYVDLQNLSFAKRKFSLIKNGFYGGSLLMIASRFLYL